MKSSKAVKCTVAIVAFALIVTMLACISLQVFGKGTANPSECLMKDGDTLKETGSLELSEIGGESGISLVSATIPRANYAEAGVSPVALDAVTVSVKSPMEGIVYKWALSMDDDTPSTYVTLSADTGTSVDLTCEAAFSNIITLTCSETVADQTLSTAFCTLNYFKRVTGVELNGTALVSSGSYDLSQLVPEEFIFKNVMKTATLTFSETMSAGTTGSVGDYYGYYTFGYYDSTAKTRKSFTAQIEKQGDGTISLSLAKLYVHIVCMVTGDGFVHAFSASSENALLEMVESGTASDACYCALLACAKSLDLSFTLTVGKGDDITGGHGVSSPGDSFNGSLLGKDNIYVLSLVSLSIPSSWVVSSYSVALDKSDIEF